MKAETGFIGKWSVYHFIGGILLGMAKVTPIMAGALFLGWESIETAPETDKNRLGDMMFDAAGYFIGSLL